MRKREDYISWDDYFLGVAFLSAMRSKDPSTQVGAVLVDQENKIVGIGATRGVYICLCVSVYVWGLGGGGATHHQGGRLAI